MEKSLIPNFPGKRWLKVFLRTAHLIGFAGVFAAILTGYNYDLYWLITVLSGIGLLILESLSNLVWFVQIRGLVMYIKFALLFAVFAFPEHALTCIILMIILAGIISHAPGSVRYYSIYHRKRIDSLNDISG